MWRRPTTVGWAWVPNTFPNPYPNSELKPDQLSLILENGFFLKWFLDLNPVATFHFLFQYTTHISQGTYPVSHTNFFG